MLHRTIDYVLWNFTWQVFLLLFTICVVMGAIIPSLIRISLSDALMAAMALFLLLVIPLCFRLQKLTKKRRQS